MDDTTRISLNELQKEPGLVMQIMDRGLAAIKTHLDQPFLELGGDPHKMELLASAARELCTIFKFLRPFIGNLSQIPLRDANDFFLADQKLDEFSSQLSDVYEARHGCKENTRQSQRLLNESARMIFPVAKKLCDMGLLLPDELKKFTIIRKENETRSLERLLSGVTVQEFPKI